MYPNCMPDIMILAEVFLQILCSHGCFTTQNDKDGKVIYTLDTICEPYIMILAQAVLEVFCSQGSIGLQSESKKKHRQRGITVEQQFQRKRKKKHGSAYFSCLFHI